MKVRDYTPEDFESCLKIFDTNVPKYFRLGEREEFATFLRELPGPYLVLLDDGGEVIGCGGYAVTEDTRSADLCWGMVHQDLHGRGYGRLLARARIEGALRDPSVCRIALNTSQHTVGFYENLGFRTVSVEKNGYAPGLDRCEMRLEVPGAPRV